MKKLFLLFTAAFCLLCVKIAAAEDDFLAITKVTDNVYNLNLNVGVVVGEEYVVLIEGGYGQYMDSNNKILAAVKSITDKPIKYVINMHSHGDHNGGNNFFAQRGATIITHKNVIYSHDFKRRYPTNHNLRFEQSLALNLGNEVIEIDHMIAHTFDDGLVYLRNSNVLFIGESFKPNHLTYLGMFGMQSFNEWGEKALAKINDDTIIVPAHGKTFANKQMLLQYRKNYMAWYERMHRLFVEGKTVEQMTKDATGIKYAELLNIDGNPEHHGQYYADSIQGLISAEINQPYAIAPTALMDYVGTYTLEGKEDIVVEIMLGRLVAKQFNSFISWLKPLDKDTFGTMLFSGEKITFARDNSGNVSTIKAIFVEKSPIEQRLTGVWRKKL